jgi:protein SCO1/2
MSRLAAIGLAMALAAPSAAFASLTPAALSEVGVHLPPGARAPLDLGLRTDQGRATTLGRVFGGRAGLLIFADYTCTSLCGPALVLAKAGLERSGLHPGSDYRVAVIGINPRDGADAARAMRQARLADDPAIDHATTFLLGDAAAIRTAAGALGYRYAYDAERDQYAHPAVAYALAPDGRVAQVVSEIGLAGPELRRALSDAGEGRGSGVTPLLMLCYGFMAAAGVYDGPVIAAMRLSAAGLLTTMLAFGIVLVTRRRRRERQP